MHLGLCRHRHAGRTDPGAGAALLRGAASPPASPWSLRRRRATARSAGSTGWRTRACSSAWSAATGPSSRRSGNWPSTTPSRPTTCRSAASPAFIARSPARGPGLLSKVGLRTFVDPRLGGGKLNAITTEDLVELTEIEGETWLSLQGVPDPRRADPRHHRRPGRQHHHGAGGADPRQPRHRHGGQELAAGSSSPRSSASRRPSP